MLMPDIAGTSIDQARERYQKMYRPGFDGHFFAFDCFSVSCYGQGKAAPADASESIEPNPAPTAVG